MKCAKENGASGYDDREVFGWAIHYYDEDDIKDVPKTPGKVVINRALELTEQEIEECKAEAKNKLIQEEKKKLILDVKFELNEEDLLQARDIAMKAAVEEAKKKILEKKKKVFEKPVPVVDAFINSVVTGEQGSLF